MDNCIFCKIIKKEVPAEIIYENESFIAFVDLRPTNYGHSLLVPKEHYENIYVLPENVLKNLGFEIQKLSKAVKKSMGADGINVHMNNEKASGQIIFHAHIHIIPRYENDGLIHFTQKEYTNLDQIKEIGKKIRREILLS